MAQIAANFSNYSAWHARTVLLPQLHAESRTLTLAELVAGDNKPQPGAALSAPFTL